MSTLASPLPVTHADPALEPAPDVALVCARCGHPITHRRHAQARDGAHVHTRINPGGWVHRFGCFAEASGARAAGPATTAHTWFPGWAWRMAECGGCGQHLGWRFEGAGSFYGLLLEQLRGG